VGSGPRGGLSVLALDSSPDNTARRLSVVGAASQPVDPKIEAPALRRPEALQSDGPTRCPSRTRKPGGVTTPRFATGLPLKIIAAALVEPKALICLVSAVGIEPAAPDRTGEHKTCNPHKYGLDPLTLGRTRAHRMASRCSPCAPQRGLLK
jgi:hypothetical protein